MENDREEGKSRIIDARWRLSVETSRQTKVPFPRGKWSESSWIIHPDLTESSQKNTQEIFFGMGLVLWYNAVAFKFVLRCHFPHVRNQRYAHAHLHNWTLFYHEKWFPDFDFFFRGHCHRFLDTGNSQQYGSGNNHYSASHVEHWAIRSFEICY